MKNNIINNKIYKYLILIPFLLWILLLYLYSSFDIGNLFNNDILQENSFIIIILSIFIYSIFNFILYLLSNNKNKLVLFESIITMSAFLFTFISDLHLLSYISTYEVGLIFFIIVQLLYFIRITISNYSKKKFIISISIRLIIFIIMFIIIKLIDLYSILNIRVSFYFSNLLINFIESVINTIIIYKNKDYNRFKSYLIFSIGLLLFIMCDVSVGLYNLFDIMGDFMWIFYTPSQVLILISGLTSYDYSIVKRDEYEKNIK